MQRFAKTFRKKALDSTIYYRKGNGKVITMRNPVNAGLKKNANMKRHVEEYMDEYHEQQAEMKDHAKGTVVEGI